MGKNVCSICQKPKANLCCGVCSEPICKSCAQFLPEETFSFLSKIPEKLSHSVYCSPCYDATVAEPLQNYQDMIEKAKNVSVYFKSQNKETHKVKRDENVCEIRNGTDRDEVILQMAFRAVEAGYNSIIDVVVNSEKVRNGSYQTQIWHGTGIPAHTDEKNILKDRSFRSQPN